MDQENTFNQLFDSWIKGIDNEAHFWDKLFASNGACGGNIDVYNFRMNPNCPFQIQEDLEKVDSRILDVGSGPYSRLGFTVGDKKLDITLLDPLACIYRLIGKKYNVKYPLPVQTGMVELLHLLFSQNQFDLVHMSNSLDHSFNPLIGLKEMLYVTKVGGKIILRHSDNEAEHEKYRGFHQWNLTIDNGNFIIWNNKTERIIVNEYLKEYVSVECVKKMKETLFADSWEYNKVVIRKIKEIQVDELYTTEYLIKIIERLVEQNARFLSDYWEHDGN